MKSFQNVIFPEIYEQMFASMGENVHDHLQLIRVDPTHKLFFHDNSSLQLTANLVEMCHQLESLESGSYHGFLDYLHQVQQIYNPSIKQIITKDFPHFWNYFTLKNLNLLIKAKGWQSHYQYLGQFFRGSRLKEAFSFQDSYIGLNPHQASSIFSIFSISELTRGVWLPQGGMYQIVKSLIKIASKYNIEIKFNTPVQRLLVKDNQIKEVVTANDQHFSADIVVANTDLAYTYQHLLPPSKINEKLQRKQFSCSTITFFWGLDQTYPQLQTHNIFLAKDNFQGYDQVVNLHQVPREPHFYVHAPTRSDSSFAPPQHDTITAIVPVGHLTEASPKNWSTLKQQTKNYVLKRFQEIGSTDFEKHIKIEMTATPHTWLNDYNLTYGATLGLHHNILQLGYLRPSRQHPEYHNLYFVGSNTHPGSGVPTVLLSAQFTAAKILEKKLFGK